MPRVLVLVLGLLIGLCAHAENTTINNLSVEQKLQANVTSHTLEELSQLLVQAEKISNGESQYNINEPIAVVLHGDEIRAFVRDNYADNKSLVDLAAKLDAFNVIDVKVCRRWMGANDVMVGDLPPFIEEVPYGNGERLRLEEAGYAYF